jgi:hypothetical protein
VQLHAVELHAGIDRHSDYIEHKYGADGPSGT